VQQDDLELNNRVKNKIRDSWTLKMKEEKYIEEENKCGLGMFRVQKVT
jgi:hypothetical protein